MSKFHDDRAQASDPVHISLSREKLRKFHPELFGWRSWLTTVEVFGRRLHAKMAQRMLAEHVANGDSRAAVVIHVHPLLIAAYTDEQDAIVLLRFPNETAGEYRLNKGDRMLTINTYSPGKELAADIVEGANSTRRWANFYPLIAEFVSGDEAAIRKRKGAIAPAEWQRTVELARAHVSKPGFGIRDGRPLLSWNPNPPAS
ncbi:MAG TPA: hypothetical protein VGG30_10905 [Pirellulales bacterium]|jgi:hypothetical protein